MTELEKALFDCAAENHENKAITGVYYKDDFITATDSTVFVKVFRPFEFEEYISNRNGGTMIETYPSILGVIPEEETRNGAIVPLSELRRAAELIPASPDEKGKRIALNLENVCLYPPRVLKVVKVFESLGDTDVRVRSYGDRIVLQSDKAIGVIMTLGVKADKHPLIENYTIESINLMADLL